MIKLLKLEEPQVLRDNADTWLQSLKDKIAAGLELTKSDKSKYNHEDIKSRLVKETHGKCAYCESFLRHVAYGDIEHIHPKSLDINKTFEWINLTLACDVCNTGKSNNIGIVDPYVDDPDDHFKFAGPMIVPRPESIKGPVTEIRLKLNRVELLQKRAERLSVIAYRLLLINQTKNGIVKEALVEDLLENELSDEVEYAAFCRSLVAMLSAAAASS